MSYTRTRRSLSGVSSQPRGMPVARSALGGLPRSVRYARTFSGVSSQPPGRRVSNDALDSIRGFGDATDPSSIASPTVADPQWARDLVAAQREMTAVQQKFVTEERFRRYLQVAATLSIPLAAAIWRAIGLGRQPT